MRSSRETANRPDPLSKGTRKRPRIAFVGQPEYFNCLYGNALDAFYRVGKFNLVWGGAWYYYAPLIDFDPDIAFFFRPEMYGAELLGRLRGKKVALSSEPVPHYEGETLIQNSDTRARLDSLMGARGRFDHFFHFNPSSVRFLREQGLALDGEFVFPVDTDMYRPVALEKKWDAVFFGRSTSHREKILGPLKRDFSVLHVAHGVFDEEFVRLVNQCRIGLNIHVEPDPSWEHRIQNMMACGIPVMTERIIGNDAYLQAGKDYIEFKEPRDFWNKFYYYLCNEGDRAVIARNGLKAVRSKLAAKEVFPELIERILAGRTSPQLLSGATPGITASNPPPNAGPAPRTLPTSPKRSLTKRILGRIWRAASVLKRVAATNSKVK